MYHQTMAWTANDSTMPKQFCKILSSINIIMLKW